VKLTPGERVDGPEGAVQVVPVGVGEEPRASPAQPQNPLVIIEPSKSWVGLDLRGLWAYREVLYFLIWRDLKVRYKQTLIGAAWAIIQPLLAMLIYTIFFGMLVRVPSDGIPYPIFVYTGILFWTFFASVVTGSGFSLIGSSSLISRVYFPRMIIPGATVGARLVDLAVASTILVGLAIYYGAEITWNIAVLPALVVLVTLLAFGVGMWTSAMNVKYRDVGVVLPVMVQLWMFASPIIYPSSLVPASWQWLYSLNPMVGIVEGARAALFGREFDWTALTVSVVVTLAVLVYSAYTFRRLEKSFADLI
jgi:lipopolysaccharide transport system permease protein